MGPRVVSFLTAHHLPGWLVPGYWTLLGLAALVGGAVTLRIAARERAVVHHQARALLAALAAALVGGYLFESLRVLPEAVLTWSPLPFFRVGRAAYGGLLGSIVAASLYLRANRQPIGPFLDRAVPAAGIAYGCVRLGCFLSGCDYGVPTASRLGVRFPPESPAALDHAARGWVSEGSRSLPVHPTQLYEAILGATAAVVAWGIYRHAPRDGRGFLLWLILYAAGRLAIEFLRGDESRGIYAGLSSAQWVSAAILVVALAWTAHLRLRSPARWAAGPANRTTNRA